MTDASTTPESVQKSVDRDGGTFLDEQQFMAAASRAADYRWSNGGRQAWEDEQRKVDALTDQQKAALSVWVRRFYPSKTKEYLAIIEEFTKLNQTTEKSK